MAERKPATKGTRKSAKRTTATNERSKGFTDEERAAMKERAQELKAEARANKNKGGQQETPRMRGAIQVRVAELRATRWFSSDATS